MSIKKESGVEWIGKIPKHWKVERLKNSVENSRNGVWGEEPKGNKLDYPCVRVADFDRDNLSVQNKELTIRNIEMSNIESVLLVHGDLLIEKSGGGEKQPVGFVVQYTKNHPAVYANFIAKLSINDKIAVSGYLKYLHATLYNQGLTKRSIKQTTGIQNLDLQSYLNEIVVYPNISEQSIIANYLDQKTSEIDKLIADKEKLIELLKEKRQAIIMETVTKGLDPNVKMKDSNVEWIGRVPEHWELKRMKYLFKIRKRIESWEEPNILSVTQKGIKIKDISTNEGQLATNYDKYQTVNAGDFVMNHMDLLTGSIDISEFYGVTSPDYRVFTIENENFFKQYFLYYFQMNYHRKIFYKYGQGVAGFGRWRLPTDEFYSFYVPIPPVKEQRVIMEYISKYIENSEHVVTQTRDTINKLKEYRQSLIYEAVTGEIDVQEMVNESGQEEVPSS